MVKSRDDVYRILISLNDTLRQLGVSRIGLFGSFARGDNTESSDVDFLVSFIPEYKNYSNFFELAELLEKYMERKVEILTEQSVSPYLRAEIEKEIGYYEVAA